MAKVVHFPNNTFVIGTTATSYYLLANLNNRQVGLPCFSFASTTPNIELVATEADINVKHDTTRILSTTSYGVTSYNNIGIGLTINASSFALPIYRVEQNNDLIPELTFTQTTLVSGLTNYYSTYLLVEVEDLYYGVPLYTYSANYPSLTPASAISIQTALISDPVIDVSLGSGATYLHPKVKAYSDMIYRVKVQLGWPTVQVEICDDAIAEYIDQTVEFYTKYTGWTEEYLVFNSNLYTKGVGVRIDQMFNCTPDMYTLNNRASAINDYDPLSYRKVVDCFSFEAGEAGGVNTLFTLEQAMAQQTYFSYMLGNAGFDLVTWHILKGWLKDRSRVLAQDPYFRFYPDEQILKILPEPLDNSSYYAMIGCRVEKPIKNLIKERWIQQYILALCKIGIGNIRSKYSGVVLFGGGSVNGNDLLNAGTTEKLALENELLNQYGEVEPPLFFHYVWYIALLGGAALLHSVLNNVVGLLC